MKNFLISATVLTCMGSATYAADEELPPVAAPSVQAAPIPPAPPLGWVYGPYTMCGDPPRCSVGVVNVQADGLNVRTAPNGYPVMSLVNGTPLIPLQKQGDWLLVAPACDLTHGRGHGTLVSHSTDVGCISRGNNEETNSSRNYPTADGSISKRRTRGRTSRTLGFTGSMANERHWPQPRRSRRPRDSKMQSLGIT